MKRALAATMKMGADGIKILIGGRLNGAEIARSEKYMEGRVPLHTLRADIDYACCVARTTYGTIGVKVWICRGEILDRGDFRTEETVDKTLTDRPEGTGRGRRAEGGRRKRKPQGRVRRDHSRGRDRNAASEQKTKTDKASSGDDSQKES
jgi:small subunit ribosomal protein S3